jgi:hypothetical protein
MTLRRMVSAMKLAAIPWFVPAAVCLLLPISSAGQSVVVKTLVVNGLQSGTMRTTYLSLPTVSTNGESFSKAQTTAKLLPKMEFTARFACRGDVDSCRPALVELRFISDARRWTLKDTPHSIRIITNGKAFSWGEFAWSGTAISENEYREIAFLGVNPETLEQISKARSVEIELGGISVSLSPKNLSDIQALATRIVPAGKRQ